MSIFKKLGDAVADYLGSTPIIKVMMMGPRAVGKTSIMASIFSESKDKISGTEIYFRAVDETIKDLSDKRKDLMYVITKQKDFTEKPQTGAIKASPIPTIFKFEMGVKEHSKTIDVEITDFPGEYLRDEKDIVTNYIKESNVIMIAIDTPYLMEEGGIYNEEKNKVSEVTNFFLHNPEFKNKLVLLVPLKCELYFHNNTIDKVTQEVEKAYVKLIEICKNNHNAVVVTPIQTLGGVEFNSFIDNTGLAPITKLSTYRYWGNPPKYAPMFCVQPLYYVMSYIANYYEWSKAQPKRLMDRISDSIASIFKDDSEFFHGIKNMSLNAMVDINGYKILQTNNILKI